jgi:hypothetical protein
MDPEAARKLQMAVLYGAAQENIMLVSDAYATTCFDHNAAVLFHR